MDPSLGLGGAAASQPNREGWTTKRKRSGTPTTPTTMPTPSVMQLKKRMLVLAKLCQQQPPLQSLTSFWKVLVHALEEIDLQDIPFALLYSAKDEENIANVNKLEDFREDVAVGQFTLEGIVGLDERRMEADLSFRLMSTILCQEPQLPGPRVLHIGHTARFLQHIAHNSKYLGDSAMLCPIFAREATLAGFLLLGMNSTTDEDDLKIFAEVLSDSVSRSVSSILLLKKVRDVQEASQGLLHRVEEAERSNFMFRHMAESATIGCAIFDSSGHPMWLNEAYISLTGVPRENFEPGMWQKAIVPEDLSKVEWHWKQLSSGKPIIPFAFRVKRQCDANAAPGSCESLNYRWLLSNAYVDFSEDGSRRRVMGWLTDISAQKWNEHLQEQRLEDALETKRQTERFIDMVSHEIRNPLSAIIQTTDGMLTLTDQRNINIHEIRENIVDGGKTIILCASHQKRIVDDILTLSKLDSNLLVISPIKVEPLSLVKNAVKMVEAELSGAQIEASISTDASYEELSVDTVLLDESRVMQILLNLITNAIKFTRSRTERYIKIRLAASRGRPSTDNSDISYVAPQPPHLSASTSEEFTEEEKLYLIFAVEDTGPGLGKDHMRKLFQHFAQASPKTYSSYGGFGLGLFICRELAELQGGQIGLSSVLGQGTTFTFYVEARRQRCDGSKRVSIPHAKLTEKADQASLKAVKKSKTENEVLSSSNDKITSTGNIDFQNLHVLVVEDNKINQIVLVRQLRLLGCKVYTADDGLQALKFLSRTNFLKSSIPAGLSQLLTGREEDDSPPIPLSVVLMDVEMPVMDGLTCVRRIREMQDDGTIHRHVPIIAVTANARGEQIAEAMRAGMDAIITKPFRIPELLPKIAAVIKNGDTGG